MELTQIRIDTDAQLETLRKLREEREACAAQIAAWERRQRTIVVLMEKAQRAITRNARLEQDLVEELSYVTANHMPGVPTPARAATDD